MEVRFELAGLGSRAAAAMTDLVLIALLLVPLQIATDQLGLETALGRWASALLYLLLSFALFAYYILFEGLNSGRTPGKILLGIRVVMDTGRPITPAAAVLRNLVRAGEYAALLLPAALTMLLHRSNKRLGDLAAGTIVVRDHTTEWRLAPVAGVGEDPVEVGPPELAEEEFRLLDRLLARLPDLTPGVQARMTVELARRFESRVPRRSTDPQEYLVALFEEERRKRRSRFATRAGSGAGRTTVTAERFVARKQEAWEAFRGTAARIELVGLRALAAAEIPAFAARYREVAADLARARTYRVSPEVIAYLERLVAAGHNALYRARARRRLRIAPYVFRDFPAAVVESWPYVLVAFLLFTIPAAVGYAVLRERPELGEEIAPPVMVSRAEQAAERQARGIGYVETENEERPVLASWIISNNIMVCLAALAGGLVGGILTVLSLVYNGLSLGIGFGVFANHHAAGYLATFIAGHGVLELTAIFISGGAGLRLAQALVAPGDLTRKDALVLQGAIAVRMIGAVVCLLSVAGAIEGLLSASDAPAAYKFAVSAASAVLLACYFASGRAYLKRDPFSVIRRP
ncbi:MAG: hypothetical protein AUF60_06720 [Gemmatimonadetes bacterium 13_1_20CM_69_28]|nr:MAG: hypothetical protein AUF60_06720 [Gemmatimonadetes bacterium 13_1_20CM_69_28]